MSMKAYLASSSATMTLGTSPAAMSQIEARLGHALTLATRVLVRRQSACGRTLASGAGVRAMETGAGGVRACPWPRS